MSDPKTERPELPSLPEPTNEELTSTIRALNLKCGLPEFYEPKDDAEKYRFYASLARVREAQREAQLLSEIALRQQAEWMEKEVTADRDECLRKLRLCRAASSALPILRAALQAVKDTRELRGEYMNKYASDHIKGIRDAEQAIQRLIDAEGK